MIILGVILAIIGLILGIHLLWIAGLIVALIGVALLFVRPGGRVWY